MRDVLAVQCTGVERSKLYCRSYEDLKPSAALAGNHSKCAREQTHSRTLAPLGFLLLYAQRAIQCLECAFLFFSCSRPRLPPFSLPTTILLSPTRIGSPSPFILMRALGQVHSK